MLLSINSIDTITSIGIYTIDIWINALTFLQFFSLIQTSFWWCFAHGCNIEFWKHPFTDRRSNKSSDSDGSTDAWIQRDVRDPLLLFWTPASNSLSNALWIAVNALAPAVVAQTEILLQHYILNTTCSDFSVFTGMYRLRFGSMVCHTNVSQQAEKPIN